MGKRAYRYIINPAFGIIAYVINSYTARCLGNIPALYHVYRLFQVGKIKIIKQYTVNTACLQNLFQFVKVAYLNLYSQFFTCFLQIRLAFSMACVCRQSNLHGYP
jgi:hypothetical protein